MVDRHDPDFDDYLDSLGQEFDIPEIYGPHPASFVLKQADPDLYDESRRKWREEEDFRLKDRARELLKEEPNASRFRRLVTLVQRQRLIPFVGAGCSIPAGYPGWRNLLTELAIQCGWASADVDKAIDVEGYETFTGQLVKGTGINLLTERIEETFHQRDYPVRGPIRILPKLVGRGFVITTNFDDLVERAFAGTFGETFSSKISGRDPSLNLESVRNNDYCLLKLHGFADRPVSQVLTPEEYDKAYGARGIIDPSRPLPKLLERIFSNQKMLFLGCSLAEDRTLELFRLAAASASTDGDPIKHYAIVERPEDPAEIAEREQFLTTHCIFPIWYPRNDHELVEGFLLLLNEEPREI